MKTVYVNQIWGKDHEVARCWIVVPKTIEECLTILFNETQQQLIKALIADERTDKAGGFHFFIRFCQFVVYFNYDATVVDILGEPHKIGISIELLSFNVSDDVDDVFKYMIKLRNAGWEERCREDITRIGQQIKNEMYNADFEIADMMVKDDPEDLSSYI
jgi:hypothetical protein